MKSRLENVTVLDSNALADEIMNEVIDIDRVTDGIMDEIVDIETMERTLENELSSVDLFNIDCAILSSLEKTQDFSKDLLEQLESGKIYEVVKKPKKKFDIMKEIQQKAMMDITIPIKDMFDKMAVFVSESFA